MYITIHCIGAESGQTEGDIMNGLNQTSDPVVISKDINKEGSRHNHVHFWVWPRYNHAHIFKDGNMIIHFNTDIV